MSGSLIENRVSFEGFDKFEIESGSISRCEIHMGSSLLERERA